MDANYGGPAFPQHIISDRLGGMTMRQWYKGAIMAAIVQSFEWAAERIHPDLLDNIAHVAADLADAALAEDAEHAAEGDSDDGEAQGSSS